MTPNLQNPIFTDETKAREWLEARVWPQGPICPHCGATGEDVTHLNGKAHRSGLYQCSQCREQFTVTVKTVFERSKIPLSKWLAALFLLTASKKGVSAQQVHRSLGISYKSSWFMMHRLREAMRNGGLLPPLGGKDMVVEVDEAYFGKLSEDSRPKMKTSGRPFQKSKKGTGHKRAILALVERGGIARTFHIPTARLDDVVKTVRANVARESRLHTDESNLYLNVGKEFAAHETVTHSADEYVRYPDEDEDRPIVTTNSVEGYFSIFKRGMKGVYQHCAESICTAISPNLIFATIHAPSLAITT